MRRKAGEEVNKAYECLRDQHYKHKRKSEISESLKARLGSKIDEGAGAQEHKPDKKPALSRLGKKITSLSEEQPAIREEEYDDVDEISESESEEPGDGKSPSRGSQ